MLGNGHILVQRFGDILDGKRTWTKELAQSNVRPTLPDAVAGDITAAFPYRSMINIINFIKAMDQVVPGFAAYETLLYSPELKFYSNRIQMDTDFNTSMTGQPRGNARRAAARDEDVALHFFIHSKCSKKMGFELEYYITYFSYCKHLKTIV